ncbi:nucleotide-binding universal stress UspA family protein [Neorhizobium galegae]|uniref:universal stress protein n=1 Tax=Neorhizobium galegae TaxID=399 RepID=UPI001AE1B836|nr:universal stress protein [Neorhizobium galegae]MBP2562449.1 nucleotide-binding universal stress UspA family protein [Neorhizobium galegae]
MSFSTILTAVRSDAGDEEIQAAARLARSAVAHLSVLLISIAAPPPVGAHMVTVSTAWRKERQADQAKLRLRADEVEKLLADALTPHNVTECYTELFHVDNIVGQDARYADLMVLGPGTLQDPALRNAVIDGALFHANLPVLLVPNETIATIEPENVVIAWNGSLEAIQAVKRGRSLLKSAREVTIAIVDPDANNQQSAQELSAYLLRSHVDSRIDVLRSDGRTTHQALDDCAHDVGADLIIMGAYGHSRLRELIFGGVTRSMLGNPKRPIFLAR